MSMEDFFKRLRPSIVTIVKNMTNLRSKWKKDRLLFLTRNTLAARMNKIIPQRGGGNTAIPTQLQKKVYKLSKIIPENYMKENRALKVM